MLSLPSQKMSRSEQDGAEADLRVAVPVHGETGKRRLRVQRAFLLLDGRFHANHGKKRFDGKSAYTMASLE